MPRPRMARESAMGDLPPYRRCLLVAQSPRLLADVSSFQPVPGRDGLQHVCLPHSYPTARASAKNLNKHGRYLARAAVSKTVMGVFPPSRVRIPPPPFSGREG